MSFPKKQTAPPTPELIEKASEALADCDILDTRFDQEYDELTKLASEICGTPTALVSLIDGHRQWFKAKVGCEPRETPIGVSFCVHALAKPDEIMMVPDASKDERFATNELVTGDPHIHFYAGAPIVLKNKVAVGTLCVIHTQPHELSTEQLNKLRKLADHIGRLIDYRAFMQRVKQKGVLRPPDKKP